MCCLESVLCLPTDKRDRVQGDGRAIANTFTWCPAVCPVLLRALTFSPWPTSKLRSTSTFPSMTALHSRRCSSKGDGALREIVVAGSRGRCTSARNTSSGFLLKRWSLRASICTTTVTPCASFWTPHRPLALKRGPVFSFFLSLEWFATSGSRNVGFVIFLPAMKQRVNEDVVAIVKSCNSGVLLDAWIQQESEPS